MRKKQAVMFGVLLVLSIVLVVQVYGYTTEMLQTNNHLETGKVHIKLEESMLDEQGNKTAYKDAEHVVAGQQISRICTVNNLGVDCYVRVRMELWENDAYVRTLTPEDLFGVNGDWVCIGEYFYGTGILPAGQQVEVCQGVQVPQSVDNSLSSHYFQIKTMAQAVQSRNFNPDFDSEEPWGSLQVEGDPEEETENQEIQNQEEHEEQGVDLEQNPSAEQEVTP